jgi:hypothetical protein
MLVGDTATHEELIAAKDNLIKAYREKIEIMEKIEQNREAQITLLKEQLEFYKATLDKLLNR